MTQDELIGKVRKRLTEQEVHQFELEVFEAGVRQDDDWWYVPVSPKQQEVRAFDYAPLLSKIEAEFEAEGTRLLLIPAEAE